MFKFDFKVDDAESVSVFSNYDADEKSDNVKTDSTIHWYDAQKIEPNAEILENLDVFRLNSTVLTAGSTTLNYIVSGCLLQDITANDESTEDITKAELNHTDLIPGVYEGGAKIWECTDDLLKYFSDKSKFNIFQGKAVLDLGCGSGVLGIYAYKCGARVQFQDYNKDVLERITIPNVLLNVPLPPKETDLNLKNLSNDVQFYSGDWFNYAELTKNAEKFEVILTSETIYNPSNQQKLLDTIDAKLVQTGLVLVAAKTYYFGVGGGLRQFEELIEKDGRFSANIVWNSTDGVSREILELRRK